MTWLTFRLSGQAPVKIRTISLMPFEIKSKENQMNNLKQVTGGAISPATAWSGDGMLAVGYKPLMWLMALLFAAVVAGCGGNSSGTATATPASNGSVTAVNLLTAGDFAILASTAVSYGGAASAVGVTGNVGLSPGTSITGFAQTMDSSNDYATASEVVAAPSMTNSGRIYAPNYTGGAAGSTGLTPAKMTTAQNDLITAYNDAKNRPAGTGTFLDAGAAGEISGLTLAPGVYTWVTNANVAINSNVTLHGTATDVWVFQIPGTLTMASAATVTLTGGALPKNIFWQVGGATVTLGSTAHIEGVILAKAAITLGSGATANSRLLAQSAVTLGGTVTQPAP
jgi:hypothetical protein